MALKQYESSIFDYSLFGDSTDGTLKEVQEVEALINSIKLWMASYEGDYIDYRTVGGFVTSALGKPMKDSNIVEVTQRIRYGIENDFTPALTIISLEVIPNFEKRRWEISLEAYSPELNLRVFINENIKELS